LFARLSDSKESVNMRAASFSLLLLYVAAAAEAATGLTLLIYPQAIIRWLFGAAVAGAGIAVGRVAGVALISFALGCWMGRHEANGGTSALAAMLTYNLLVTIYLTSLGIGGELVGILLWPAIALHAVLTVLLGYTCFKPR
jgi:hypothetical protein